MCHCLERENPHFDFSTWLSYLPELAQHICRQFTPKPFFFVENYCVLINHFKEDCSLWILFHFKLLYQSFLQNAFEKWFPPINDWHKVALASFLSNPNKDLCFARMNYLSGFLVFFLPIQESQQKGSIVPLGATSKSRSFWMPSLVRSRSRSEGIAREERNRGNLTTTIHCEICLSISLLPLFSFAE